MPMTQLDVRKEYSIWLLPYGSNNEKLSEIISKLSKRFSHSHQTPKFEPHVTLIGQIKANEKEVIKKVEDLASCTEPFHLKLGNTEHSENYFKCLFAQVENAHELAKIRKNAEESFCCHEPYFPHLSIMYGLFSTEEREALTREMGNLELSLDIRKTAVYLTSGSTERWNCIATFDLGCLPRRMSKLDN